VQNESAGREGEAVERTNGRVLRGRYQPFAAVIVALWLLALNYLSLGTCRDGNVTYFANSTVVLFGWMGIATGMLGWYANIPLGVAVWRMARGRAPGRWTVLVGLGLALTTFAPVELMHNEAWSEPVCQWGPGFWLWFSCSLVAALALVWPASGPWGLRPWQSK
jgi:hypothetical protein